MVTMVLNEYEVCRSERYNYNSAVTCSLTTFFVCRHVVYFTALLALTLVLQHNLALFYSTLILLGLFFVFALLFYVSYILCCTVGGAWDFRFSLPHLHCSYCAYDNKALNLKLFEYRKHFYLYFFS